MGLSTRVLLLTGLLGGCTEPTPAPPAAPDLAVVDLAPEDEPDLRLPPVSGPERLSETGLYGDFAARTLAPGVISFVPRYGLWADGADKERFLLLPPGTVIDTGNMDEWVFPVGTKVWKHFRVGGRIVETRLLWKVRSEGRHRGWWKMAYVWDQAGTEANAAPLGAPLVSGTTHDVPTQMQCDDCHRAAPDVLLGVGALQLSTGDGKGLLLRLGQEGRLSAPPAGEFAMPGSGVVQQTLGYLHGNCGTGCHNERNPLSNPRIFLMEVHVGDKVPENTDLYRTTIGKPLRHMLPDGQTIAVVPGAPDKSGLWGRMSLRDASEWQMPPLASKVVDAAGVATVKAWIASLPPR